MLKVNILKKGDEVLTINDHFVAIKRKNGEVDVYNLFFSESGLYVDPLKAATIGYGNGMVERTLNDGDTKIVEF